MWSRRIAVCTAVLPLALLVTWDAPRGISPPRPGNVPAEARQSVPRPAIVGRAVWRADEDLVQGPAKYTGAAKAVFVHHTDHPNDYDCAKVPAMLRAMQSDHVRGQGWDDLGYNFVVDRCGTIYEGRSGGVGRSVHGAHTKGFNADSVGIGALGNFGPGTKVPKAMVDAIVRIAAWKLRAGADPQGKVRLVSTHDDSRYPKGDAAVLHVISGHRDTYRTRCPGDAMYERLPAIRQAAARLRER
ncbi:peptidoglycan recognition protein family protein [Streptomyces gobiensis]|uniref:peptidoglycan recognition protein family protein n=1 Tax=Streptomyces gobiensis TaxID=2875706 RepID=UPI001E330584|nr:peptidoglycan recognition protein [Streptomyces gobiensis]UGY92127.1 peptidoglycan recognition protein [Streptomyces gobiensis]